MECEIQPSGDTSGGHEITVADDPRVDEVGTRGFNVRLARSRA